MGVHSLVLFAAWLVAVSPGEAFPDDDANPRPLEPLIAEALAANPQVQVDAAAVAAARERVVQAYALPDPAVGLVYTNDGWSPTLGREDMTTLSVMASQTLPARGIRDLRRGMAAAEIVVAEGSLARTRRRVAAEVASTYERMVLARSLLAIVEDRRRLWHQVEDAARALYAAGPGRQSDVLAAQVELTRIEESALPLVTEQRILAAQMNGLLARPLDATVEVAGVPRIVAEPSLPADGLVALEPDHPELAAAAAAVERERLAVLLASRQRRPDLTVQAAYMNRGTLPPMWQAGVSATLPLRKSRLNAAQAEADARLRGAEAHLREVQLVLRLRTEERLARLDSLQHQDAIYSGALLRQQQMVADSVLARYRAGLASQVEVLGELDALVNARAEQLRIRSRHEQTRIALREASLDADAEAQ